MRVVIIMKNMSLLFVLFICGCTSPHFASLDKTVFSPAYWNKAMSEQQAKESRLQIEQSLTRENIEKAQKVILYSRQEKVSELLLADLYTEVTNRLIQTAEQETITGKPDKAGKFYRMAQEIYPEDSRLQSTITLSLDKIDSNIDQCADTLMEKGLIAYRTGDLNSAITIWQEISQFHPSHTPSLIASNTARQQLKSLEMLSAEREL